jgi:hypothetical protein
MHWSGNEREVLPCAYVGIHESAIALLLDGVNGVTHGCQDPFLSVVILRWPGDEREIVPLAFMGIHESAIALLLYGVRTVT